MADNEQQYEGDDLQVGDLEVEGGAEDMVDAAAVRPPGYARRAAAAAAASAWLSHRASLMQL